MQLLEEDLLLLYTTRSGTALISVLLQCAMDRRKVVFLDRDGTINRDEGYTVRPEDLKIYPGAGVAVGRLKAAGYAVVVVTNQSAIGRGIATVADVEKTNAECLRQLSLEDERATIDAVCLCPHAPDENCKCRKPLTGMVADLKFEYVAQDSWLIGDKGIDLEFGRNLKLPLNHCLLVRTGYGAHEEKAAVAAGRKIDPVADNLNTAVDLILGG